MHLGGAPNDLLNNFNPLALIIFIPIFDQGVYPLLRKMNIRVTPLRRITAGFWVASSGMVVAAVTQFYVYKFDPCGHFANKCLDEHNLHSTVSVWVQPLIYILGGISEILASITSLEYAFTKAPRNMRSLIQAVALFMNAFSAALGEALVGLAADPLLVWNYTTVALLSFLGGVGFWLTNYKLDRREDELNYLPQSEFVGRQSVRDEEK